MEEKKAISLYESYDDSTYILYCAEDNFKIFYFNIIANGILYPLIMIDFYNLRHRYDT